MGLNIFNQKPKVKEVSLQRNYKFMYENFVISTQSKLVLLLEKSENDIHVIEFNSIIFKYGSPNDEVAHPLQKYGLGFYGFFEVENSFWIVELEQQNSQHTYHDSERFKKLKHFIAKFKDTTLEVVSEGFEEKIMTTDEVAHLINEQLYYLQD